MSEKMKVKYIGTQPTRVRLEPNGVKVDVQPDDVVEMDGKWGNQVLKENRGKWEAAISKGEVDKKKVEKN